MNQTDELTFSKVLVALFRNVVYRERHADSWQVILEKQNKINDYVGKLGLRLIVDDKSGFAYLKQRDYGDGEDEIPRLVPRRELSYNISLLLVLLARKLSEFDASTGEQRLIVTRSEIIDGMKLYLPDTNNEVRQIEKINQNIEQVIKMGFLRRLRKTEDSFEVERIIRAILNADELERLDERLAAYRQHVENTGDDDGRTNELI